MAIEKRLSVLFFDHFHGSLLGNGRHIKYKILISSVVTRVEMLIISDLLVISSGELLPLVAVL